MAPKSTKKSTKKTGHKPTRSYSIGNKFAVAKAWGRPKIFDDAFMEKEADEFLTWMAEPCNLWFEDFALERGYLPRRMYEWEKKNSRFKPAFEAVSAMQKSKLIKGGLFEETNPGFTKFVMANACDWYEKKVIKPELTSKTEDILSKIDGGSKELVADDEDDD